MERNPSQTLTPRKRKRKEDTLTSKSIKYFTEINQEDKLDPTKTHICNLCQQKKNGAKEWNLVSHLQKCHPQIYNSLFNHVDAPQVKRLQLLQRCTEIVGVNGRPFSYLLDSGFQGIIRDKLDELHLAGFGINLTHQNLTEVKAHLRHTAQKIKEKIQMETANRPLSLVVDLVSRRRRSICGFSVQYIVNGQLKIRSIGMIELLQAHTGKYIAEVIIERLKDYGISLRQIITITTDNGSNVLKMVRDINDHLHAEIEQAKRSAESDQNAANESQFDSRDADSLIEVLLNEETELTDDDAMEILFEETQFDSNNNVTLLNALSNELTAHNTNVMDITGINCAAHTLQLAIHDSISKLPKNFQNVIALCRRVCKFMRLKSTSVALETMGIEHSLPRIENATRWCSLFLMVYITFSPDLYFEFLLY